MSAYRFCRTDDIGLLVDALNRCWTPHFPAEPPATPAAFKRSIRDLQVWCSSCMVAFAGGDPVGVLIGAKRESATLIHRIAVHPDHLRQGHGRHMLESIGSKLAILGPPRIVAEVPGDLHAPIEAFGACGYVHEATLTDYVFGTEGHVPARGGLVIPVTVDDLDANGLLDGAGPPTCWERSAETLRARKDGLEGLAVATDEGLEAYLLYKRRDGWTELAAFRSLIDDGGERLAHLVGRVRAGGAGEMLLPKVHPEELAAGLLAALGFQPAATHRLLAATAGQR